MVTRRTSAGTFSSQRPPHPLLPGFSGDIVTDAPMDSSRAAAYTSPTADSAMGDEDATNAWAGVSTPDRSDGLTLPPLLRLGNSAPVTRKVVGQDTTRPKQIGSTDATPRSSWESERSSKAEAKSAFAARKFQEPMGSSPPTHSTNPFRRVQEAAEQAPEVFEYSEESNGNPWTTETSTGSTPTSRLNANASNHETAEPSRGQAPYSESRIKFDSSPQDQPQASRGEWHEHAAKLGAKPIANYMHSPDFSRDTRAQNDSQVRSPNITTSQVPEMAPGSPQRETSQSQRPFSYSTEHFQEPPYMASPGPSLRPQHLLESSPSPYAESPGPSALPRQLLETPPNPPAPPPRLLNPNLLPKKNINETTVAPVLETPSQDPPKQKKATETYQIRLVNWLDASSPASLRRSPIMVQNANGPCPLLALVNALVLSTPSTITTPLVETLRVREQVSLGLLLDAVIDELMSGRRGDAAQNLPDVSELYAFLVNLHTGMNVNPRFVHFEEAPNLMDAPVDLPIDVTPELQKPGGFEETREMRLYRIFAISLIHGWIPSADHPAFASLRRAARTYEDAQNLMFREEELEDKLKVQGLNQEEQIALEDISSIKYFLSSTATQLTEYGLGVVTQSLAPGSLAIFFRNDHFSTLYRHPQSGRLLTLVTDMGYAGHEEVVWESLVDISGERSEFYSGDFRPVGNIPQNLPHTNERVNGSVDNDETGWTTVANKRARTEAQTSNSDSHALAGSTSGLPQLETLNINKGQSSLSPNVEQEDHDLALAMQLQEEEEERERSEAAARRRENELSQAYLNNADASGRRTFPGFGRGATGGATGGPNVPPRGGSQQGPGSRPPVRRRTSEDAPPPSYEQAAKGPAYHPPANHPSYSPNLGGNVSRPVQPPRPRVGSSAYSEHAASASYGGSPSAGGGPRRGPGGRGPSMPGPPVARRRTNGYPLGAGPDDDGRKDKDCVVM